MAAFLCRFPRSRAGPGSRAFPVTVNLALARVYGLRYEGHPGHGRGSGGDEGTRTPDPRDANAVLFQLSYIPTGPIPCGARPLERVRSLAWAPSGSG